MNVILLIGAVQAAFFALLVFNKENKAAADRILGFWLITLSANLTIAYLAYLDITKYYYLGILSSILFPVLSIWLFLYTKTLTSRSFQKKWLLHFLLMIIIGLASVPYFAIGAEELLQMYSAPGSLNFTFMMVPVINLGIFTVYTIKSLLVLLKHRRNIRFEFSYTEKIDLNWLRYLVYSLMVMLVVFFSMPVLIFVVGLGITGFDHTLYIFLVAFIFGIGFLGFKQGKIFQYHSEQPLQQQAGSDIPNVKSREKGNDDEELRDHLNHYMQSKKPYLDPTLSLYDLASTFGIPSNVLSVHLNRFQHLNFYEFVNYYRVQEAKARLKENNQKFTILSIAYDCGFNSKATFNRIFKNTTGFTPSEYAVL